MEIQRHDVTTGPGPRMSRMVEWGHHVFLCGLVAKDISGDVQAQTRDILAQIDSYLAKAGTSKSRLLQAQIWLPDMGDFKAMNEVWNGWVDPENPPVRACVQAGLARPEIRVEIMVTAAKP